MPSGSGSVRVEEHDVRPLVLVMLQRLRAGVGEEDGEALASKREGGHVAQIHVVFGQQDLHVNSLIARTTGFANGGRSR